MACVLSDFDRGRIVGAREAGASIAETSQLIGVSKTTVCRIMAEYKEGKTSPNKSSGRKHKLDSRQQRSLKRIVKMDRRISALKATAALNNELTDSVSSKTVRRELHNMNLYGRAAIAKPLIRSQNADARKRWCREHEGWTDDQWKKVVWSDESSFTLFPTTGRVYVWRSPEEAYLKDCLLPTVKHGGGSVMVWAAMSWYELGPIVAIRGKIKATDYQKVLNEQVLPMMKTIFPGNDGIFQDDNAPVHTAKIIKSWYQEHGDDFTHLEWPAQSPDLNIIEPLWSTLEARVRQVFPPPSSLKQLEKLLIEEWYNIPMETVHKLYESIPRRIQAVLSANGGPTPY